MSTSASPAASASANDVPAAADESPPGVANCSPPPNKKLEHQQVQNSSTQRSKSVDDSMASTASSCGESVLLCSDADENEEEEEQSRYVNNNNNGAVVHHDDDDTDYDHNDENRIQWTTTKPGSSSLNENAQHSTLSDPNGQHPRKNGSKKAKMMMMMMMTGEEVKRQESKGKKIKTRIVAGAFMFSIFAGSVRIPYRLSVTHLSSCHPLLLGFFFRFFCLSHTKQTVGLGFHLLLLDSIFGGLYIFWSLSSRYTFFLNKYKHAQVYSGHLYVCATVALVEFLLFRELVRVRYSTFYASTISENRIPLFRTTQWMWFCLAIFYTYGDFVTDIVQNNAKLHYLLRTTRILQYWGSISFVLYSATFVLTIATLQRKHIKFQINQLCWTVLVLCLTVGQLKYVMHNIFNGLIWYVLPCCLVFTNDIMAYVTGMTFGRKFIHRPFIKFSPNKTWEGFIGGGFFTMVVAWYLSRRLAQSTWMTCPTNEFTLAIGPRRPVLSCRLDPIFQPAQSILPASAIFESLLPRALVTHPWIPLNIVDICSFPQQQQHASTSSAARATTSPMSPLVDLFPHLGSSSSARYDQDNVVLGKCLASPLDSYETSSDSSSPSARSSSSTTVSFDYETQVHHHYELIVKDYYPIQFHALWLALFASLVAPFGGFFASAMKRAYGIKDFDGIIPGHGGIMDRMDCQFLMALCTWVHYNTFVKLATISVPKLTYMYSLLSEQEKLDFLQTIGAFRAPSDGASSKQAAVVETLADYAFG
jgi:CDP-diglyceride synthetase